MYVDLVACVYIHVYVYVYVYMYMYMCMCMCMYVYVCIRISYIYISCIHISCIHICIALQNQHSDDLGVSESEQKKPRPLVAILWDNEHRNPGSMDDGPPEIHGFFMVILQSYYVYNPEKIINNTLIQ